MSRPLSVILVGLLIDDAFRNALVEARAGNTLAATLKGFGFFLNNEELVVAHSMVGSFVGSGMESTRIALKDKCPDWPCNRMMIIG